MSYLRYLCLFAYSSVCCCFFRGVCVRPVSCVANVASFPGLSIFLIAPSVFSNVYLQSKTFSFTIKYKTRGG